MIGESHRDVQRFSIPAVDAVQSSEQRLVLQLVAVALLVLLPFLVK